jgi:hypothetical protein
MLRLEADKHANDDDEEIDRHGKPVLVLDMLHEAAQQHLSTPDARLIHTGSDSGDDRYRVSR